MIDLCLSALAAAWVVMFVATTGLFAALAVEAVWDRSAYMQTLREAITTDPPN
jgi:hypothetical protein